MENSTKKNRIQFPLVCTRGVIIFPDQEVIIDVGRSKSVHAVEEAQSTCDSHVILVAQKDLTVENPGVADLYEFGTLCTIKHIRRMDGYLRVKFRGLQRAKIVTIMDDEHSMCADVELKDDILQDQMEEIALVRKIAKQFENMEPISQNMPKEMINELSKGVSAPQLADQISQLFPFSL